MTPDQGGGSQRSNIPSGGRGPGGGGGGGIGGGIIGALLPLLFRNPKLLIVVLILGALWFFFGKGCNTDPNAAGGDLLKELTRRILSGQLIQSNGMSTLLTTTTAENRRKDLSEGRRLLEAGAIDEAIPLLTEAATFGNFRSAFMGLVDRHGNVDHYGGWLRVVDADGSFLADKLDPKRFNEVIGEAVEPWSYLKSTYWKPMGYPDGIYRVGPLARVNVADHMGTPRADEELQKFRWRVGRIATSSFHYHYARLIDTLHAIEKIEELLRGPHILDKHVRSRADVNRLEGIGVSEAPRGTLMHHYRVDENGIMQWANLVIATGHNNMAMNRAVLQVARHHVKSQALTEPMLNRVEAVIRCYDPCLSCSTHALGEMPMRIELLGPDGAVLDTLVRDEPGACP